MSYVCLKPRTVVLVQFTDLLRRNLDNQWSILIWIQNKYPGRVYPWRNSDVIIGGGIPLAGLNQLKMFQISWGWIHCSPETMPAEFRCNCFEHETTIAEYVIGAILELTIDFAKWTGGSETMDGLDVCGRVYCTKKLGPPWYCWLWSYRCCSSRACRSIRIESLELDETHKKTLPSNG